METFGKNVYIFDFCDKISKNNIMIGENMLPRQVNLANIEKYLIYIESDIQTNNYCRFYDINIISESFCCDLLNISFGLDLENTNLFKRNQKAIDLVDKKEE